VKVQQEKNGWKIAFSLPPHHRTVIQAPRNGLAGVQGLKIGPLYQTS